MIVDASAIVAVLWAEPDAKRYTDALEGSPRSRMSVVNYLEAAIVLESRGGPSSARELDHFIERAKIELTPVTVRQGELARDAWRRYGKGRRPRGLNLGDCFAYALAIDTGEPLLFKGDDFTRTDVVPA